VAQVPELVLVHGAWHGPWCWEPLLAQLTDVRVHTVALTSAGHDPAALGDLFSDADAVRQTVSGIEAPVVLCGHSYGGVVISEAAAGLSNVAGLVYLCAFQLDAGESLASDREPPDWWEMHDGYVSAGTPHEIFYTDLPEETVAPVIPRLGYQALAPFTQQQTQAAWREIPSTYLVCTLDKAIPVEAQEAMAQRAKRVVRMDTAHSPFLSRPAEVAGLLREELAAASVRSQKFAR
jgi:pimeloyl-ACP methyl ester carboxylesterase